MRCTIVPPYLLSRLVEVDEPPVADRARRALDLDARFRARRPGSRDATSGGPQLTADEQDVPEDPPPRRRIRDVNGGTDLPGRMVRREGEPATDDAAADEAYDGLGATWQLLNDAYGRDSLNGRGMPLRATVHFGEDYANAFWDGTRMVFGDGDGQYFHRFTISIDVIGHELAHGVTEHTADLVYSGQSGALNESMSDVFGSLVKQRELGQSADQADWLIGAELFTERVRGEALRSMMAPGTAYDDPVLGTDPQPATMDDYVETTDDNGGVHINSGIPNHAFYVAATTMGGKAWEKAGLIWYDSLRDAKIRPTSGFKAFARATVRQAQIRFGDTAPEVDAVRAGWDKTKVKL